MHVLVFLLLANSLFAHEEKSNDRGILDQQIILYDEIAKIFLPKLEPPSKKSSINEQNQLVDSILMDKKRFIELVRKSAEIYFADPSPQMHSPLQMIIGNLAEKSLKLNWLRIPWGTMIGWIYEKKQERGIDWVIATLVFEIAEHSILFWIPPGFAACEAFQLLYLSTSGCAWRLHGLLKSQTGAKKISLRTALKLPHDSLLFRKRTGFVLNELNGEKITFRAYKKQLRREAAGFLEDLKKAEKGLDMSAAEKENLRMHWHKKWGFNRLFWQDVYILKRTEGKGDSFRKSIETDNLDQLTLGLDEARLELAFLNVQKETITDVTYETFEHGQISRLKYYEIKKKIGRLGRIIEWSYKSALIAGALNKSLFSDLEWKELVLQRQVIRSHFQSVLDALTSEIFGQESNVHEFSEAIVTLEISVKNFLEGLPAEPSTVPNCLTVFATN